MNPEESNALLRTRDLSREFGSLRAVDRVNFSIQPGETRAIIGPNGAGKTTFFNLISGDLSPSSGSIFFKAEEITNLSRVRRTQLGLGRTYQVSRLFPKLTVQQNLRLAVQGLTNEKYSLFADHRTETNLSERIHEILERFKLKDNRSDFAEELSHGSKRKLEVALGCAGHTELLLLDEPTAGLSPDDRDKMFDLIESLDDNLTVLLIEHDLDLALGLADCVTCFHQGRILAEDKPGEIQHNDKVREVYLGNPQAEG